MTKNKQSLPIESPNTLQRMQTFTRLFRLFVIAAVLSFLICLLIGLTNGIWQVVVVGFTSLGSLFFGSASQSFARQKRPVASETMAVLGFVTAFALPNLFWANATIYFLLGGSLIILISEALLSTRWSYRLIILISFISSTLIFSAIDRFPRYNIQDSQAISILLPAITLLIFLGALWQLIRTLQISTIRSRLLFAFILAAVVPLVIAAIVASMIGSRVTTDAAVDLLTAVSTLKEQALYSWAQGLQDLLHSENLRDQELQPIVKLLNSTPDSIEYKRNYLNLADRLSSTVSVRKEFEEIFILNKYGKVLLSTNHSHEGLDLSQAAFFKEGISSNYFQPPSKLEEFDQTGVVVSEPVVSQEGETLGVVAGYSNLDQVYQIMGESAGIGDTGETYLVDSNYKLLTPSRYNGYMPGETEVMSHGALNAILGKQSGYGSYDNYNGVEVIGVYRWLPDMKLALFAEQSREEVFAPTVVTIAINSAVSIFLILGTVLFAVTMTNSIANPITDLTRTAQRIADGELELNAAVGHRRDEIADLATSFNKMTQQLRNMIGGLEELVKVRTKQLEIRSDQLQAASQLGSAATSILEPGELVTQVVNMIQEQFGLYYVGLFLVDEAREYAVLQSGTGIAGREMVARNHRIKIGQGMIGWCILNETSRVSQPAGEDSIRLAVPDLPETRSEAAIPLRSRGQVLGAISIQSREPNAFDESTVATFQTMADQVAVAIDNARLFAEAQNALEATRRAYGEMNRQAWLDRLSTRAVRASRSHGGFSLIDISDQQEIFTAGGKSGSNGGETHDTEKIEDIPIFVRGMVIGHIHAQKGEKDGSWSREERELLGTLTEQLGVALDSARLFEETLLRAERERMVSEITSRVRETLDIDTVLKTAAKELQKMLDLEEVEVRMNKG